MAVSPLGTFVRISSQSVDPAAYPDRHFDLFSIPGFDNGQQPERVVGSQVGSNKYKVVSECVLVSKINPRIKRIWYVGSADPTRAVCSTEFVQLVPIVRGIDLRFLEHFLLHADLERLTATAAQAATKSRQRFLPNALLSIPFHLPPLGEQRRIVGLLDRAAEIRRRAGTARAKARAIIPALFLDAFGDPATNPKGWSVVPFSEVVKNFRYGTNQKCVDKQIDVAIPVLRIPNIIGAVIDWRDLKYAVLPDTEMRKLSLLFGDLLFVRTNGNPDYIGRCAVYREERQAAYASYLIRARLSERMSSTFVCQHFTHPIYRPTVVRAGRTTAGNYNLSTEGLGKLPLIAPPIPLQTAFAEQVQRLEALARHLDAGAAKAEAMAAALSAEMFE